MDAGPLTDGAAMAPPLFKKCCFMRGPLVTF